MKIGLMMPGLEKSKEKLTVDRPGSRMCPGALWGMEICAKYLCHLPVSTGDHG